MPAYTMGKSKKGVFYAKAEDTPGVGTYNQQSSWNKSSRIKSMPSNSIGKDQKFHTFKTIENVGPGSYNVDKPENANGPTLKGRHQKRFDTEAPSPAEYKVEKKFASKQYSFGHEKRKIQVKEGPGPNVYEVKDLNKTCGYSFGKQDKEPDLNHAEKYPGPGNYQNKSQKSLQQVPVYSFVKEKKFREDQLVQNSKSKIPGPGAYVDSLKPKKFCRGGKFTNAPRDIPDSQTKSKPGVGTYELKFNSVVHQSGSHRFGNSSRLMTESRQYQPGPGTYNTPQVQSTKKKYGSTIFTQSNRKWINPGSSPGPAAYDVNKKSHESMKGPSMGVRSVYESKQVRPGPQKYNPEYKNVQKTNGNIIIGSETKFRRLKTQNPGPGQYESNKQIGGKSFFFGRSSRKEKLNDTVGPGQYKIKPYFGMYDGREKEQKQFLYV